MTFQYDREADILYMNTCEPYPEQESEELEDEIIARFNPNIGEIENLEVLFFQRVCYKKNFFNYQLLHACNCLNHEQSSLFLLLAWLGNLASDCYSPLNCSAIHRNRQFMCATSKNNPLKRRYIRIISPPRNSDVLVSRDLVIGRVKVYPTNVRQIY